MMPRQRLYGPDEAYSCPSEHGGCSDADDADLSGMVDGEA